MDAVSDKQGVDGPADAPSWAVGLGAGTLVLLFSTLGLVAAGGWGWFASFLSSSAPNWLQAGGAIAAIYFAGRGIKLQLREQARQAAEQLVKQADQAREERREADVHRLQIIGAALFHCRVAGHTFRGIPGHGGRMRALRRLQERVQQLGDIRLGEYPDADSLHAVTLVSTSLATVFHSVEQQSGVSHNDTWAAIQATRELDPTLKTLDIAEELVQMALLRRDADLLPLCVEGNGIRVASRSFRPK